MAALAISGCGASKGQTAANETRKIPVTIETVKKGSLVKSVPLGGLLTPQNEVSLAAKLPTAKITSVPVKVGDTVAAGTPVVIFDGRDIDLQLSQAQLAYDRNKQLYDTGAVSKLQLEQALNALDTLKLQSENMLLRSPVDGMVASVSAVEGQLAGAVPLVSIVNIDRLKLQVQVGESYISRMQKAGKLAVKIPALSEEPYEGTITTVAPQIDSRTKAYPVTLEIENKDGSIKGGMYAEVELQTDRKDDIIIVPQQAILEMEEKKVVYVVENDTAKMRVVQVGLTLGEQAEIIKGLNPGDLLIVEGQYGVKEGSPVTPVTKGDSK